MQTFSTAITEYTIRNDGIVVGRDINPETPRTTANIAESFDRLSAVTQGKRFPGLWDARLVPEFPFSVWQVFVDRIDKVVSALAILVDSEADRAFGAFPKAIDSMLIPVRVFQDEDEAIAWLGQFVDKA
ncbi:MAG: hypothetical protein QNJ75_01175 [Acidimicrobiia bacterium]|nr:hypothetical protein [Acidimicrobiia bacterium]